MSTNTLIACGGIGKIIATDSLIFKFFLICDPRPKVEQTK